MGAAAIAIGARSEEWGAEIQICCEPRADRWKMCYLSCTCRLGCRNSNLIPTMAREFTKWQGRRLVRTGSAKV